MVKTPLSAELVHVCTSGCSCHALSDQCACHQQSRPAGALLLPQHMDAKVILEARRRIVGPNVTLLFDEPIHMVRGEGVHLYDADGNEYLDTVNNVAHVGHCHPKVLPSLLSSSCM